MDDWLRRLRGALGIGALWGVVGAAGGTVVAVVVGITTGMPVFEALANFGLGGGGIGFVLGTTFAGTLTFLERRRTLAELTPGRAAKWGALAGAGVALSVGINFFAGLSGAGASIPLGRTLLALLAGTGAYAALTAALAAGTIAIGRRGVVELESGSVGKPPKLVGAASENREAKADRE